jgi:hypothetical protein
MIIKSTKSIKGIKRIKSPLFLILNSIFDFSLKITYNVKTYP